MLLPLALGLFNLRTRLDAAPEALVTPALRVIIPPCRCFVNERVLLFFIFIGALHADGLARTCPLRGPLVHLNFKLCDAPDFAYALVVASNLVEYLLGLYVLFCLLCETFSCPVLL